MWTVLAVHSRMVLYEGSVIAIRGPAIDFRHVTTSRRARKIQWRAAQSRCDAFLGHFDLVLRISHQRLSIRVLLLCNTSSMARYGPRSGRVPGLASSCRFTSIVSNFL
ncbi:hypothetical protein AcV7_007731 [Taiwanofungus camphoratus]|nr:hypothetical protein AcW2_006984 [Antrodia cinnamomea]KAI0951711.1 hypothetical protein AcV7_007731 [Antrodia cinnamomea]